MKSSIVADADALDAGESIEEGGNSMKIEKAEKLKSKKHGEKMHGKKKHDKKHDEKKKHNKKKHNEKKHSEKKHSEKKHSKKHSKKEKKERVARPKSVSGKYTSTRNLMEVLFAKNKDLEKEVADKLVKKEFPDSGYAKRVKKGGSHFPWYKSHIVHHLEFNTIDKPKWAKGAMAKIK